MKGRFLTLEGIDYTWKTPFTDWLKRDFSDCQEIVITRDPPYLLSPWDLFKDFFEKGENLSRLAEALMLLSARLDNNERVIIPAFTRGALVIADRYLDSWFAYQTVRLKEYFRGDGEETREFLLHLNSLMATEGFLMMPDLTVLISDDSRRTIKRKNQEKGISKYDELDIQQAAHEQYQLLRNLFPERIVEIEVMGKDIHRAYDLVKIVVGNWLKKDCLFLEAQALHLGDKIMALRQLTWTLWTLDEFEDYPLIVESGDMGTVICVSQETDLIQVEWDKDLNKALPKTLNWSSPEKYSCIRL